MYVHAQKQQKKNNKFKFEEPVVNGLVWSNTLKSFFDASE